MAARKKRRAKKRSGISEEELDVQVARLRETLALLSQSARTAALGAANPVGHKAGGRPDQSLGGGESRSVSAGF